MMTRLKLTVCMTSLLGLAAFATSAWTQDERSSDRPTAERKAPGVDPVRGEPQKPGPREDGRGNEGGRGNPAPDVDGPPRQNSRDGKGETVRKTVRSGLAALAESLRDAKDEAERKTATEAIRKHLDKQFELDLAVREQELAAVEERVNMLRQQLDRRKTSKDEIITLRLKTILNNAEGLGFPGDEGFEAKSRWEFGPRKREGLGFPRDEGPEDRVPGIRRVPGGDRAPGPEQAPGGDRGAGGEKERARERAPDGDREPAGERAPAKVRIPVPEGRSEPK